MRQTGRTTRIVDFAVEQIFSVGEVIVTDHISYTNPELGIDSLKNFVWMVESRVDLQSRGKIVLESKISKVNNILVVHFRIKK